VQVPQPVNIGTKEFTDEATQLAWHLDLGLAYKITNKVAIDLSYRYLDLGSSLKLDNNTYTERGLLPKSAFTSLASGPNEIIFKPTHQVVLGFRYTFI
jgi:opacity protein-like surface antigen